MGREPLRNEAESKFCVPEFEAITHCAISQCLQEKTQLGKESNGGDGGAPSMVDEIRLLERQYIACGNAKSLFTENINQYWREQLEYNERPEVKKGGKGS